MARFLDKWMALIHTFYEVCLDVSATVLKSQKIKWNIGRRELQGLRKWATIITSINIITDNVNVKLLKMRTQGQEIGMEKGA